MTYVDLPAPPPSSEGHVGTEELPAEHLARLRDSDALLHVVRAFEDPSVPHPDGIGGSGARPRAARPRVHPGRPRDGRAPPRAARGRAVATARRPSASRTSARRSILRRLKDGPRAPGHRSATSASTSDEAKAIRGFRFLTEKPVLVLLNVGEDDSGGRAGARGRADRRRLRPSADDWSTRSRRKIEMELGELEPDEAAAFHGGARDRRIGPRSRHRPVLPAARADLVPDRGPGRGSRLADPATARPPSTRRRRSTPTSRGASSAPRRSAYEDLARRSARWPRRARPARLRSEGKTYRVQDGDVLEILFSR